MAQIKNSERVYVAISYYEQDAWTHKPDWYVVDMSEAGQKKQDFENQVDRYLSTDAKFEGILGDTIAKNLRIVSLAAANRAYRGAINNYYERLMHA